LTSTALSTGFPLLRQVPYEGDLGGAGARMSKTHRVLVRDNCFEHESKEYAAREG
jgi:hypothetical protein